MKIKYTTKTTKHIKSITMSAFEYYDFFTNEGMEHDYLAWVEYNHFQWTTDTGEEIPGTSTFDKKKNTVTITFDEVN